MQRKKWINIIILAFFLLAMIDVPVLAVETQNGVKLTETTIQKLFVGTAYGTCGDDLTWEFADGVLTISGNGDMWNYSLEDSAPWQTKWRDINKIVIENGITAIGDWAFESCNITELEIPDTVSSIGEYAFLDCTELKNVVLSNNLQKIGKAAFSYTGLTRIEIPRGVKIIDDELFYNCRALESVVLSEGVTTLANFSFGNCWSLNKIYIPKSVMEIQLDAFDGDNKGYITIYGYNNSYAETYAHDHYIPFIAVEDDIPEPDENVTTIQFEKDSYSCLIDDAIRVQANISYSKGEPTNEMVQWFVGDTTVVQNLEIPPTGVETEKNVKWIKGLKAGSTTITVRTSDGASAVVNVEVTEKGFSAQTDGWSFANAAKSFDYAEDYEIPLERYKEVFGKSGALMQTVKWGGNCFGMSATAIKFYLDQLNWQHYQNEYSDKNFDTVNSFYVGKNSFFEDSYMKAGHDSSITHLIESYQIWQKSVQWYAVAEKAYIDYEENYWEEAQNKFIRVPEEITVHAYEHNTNGDYIRRLLNKLQTAKHPYIININGTKNHSVVFRMDKEIEQLEDDLTTPEDESKWYRVYIYDPNNPYYDTERYGNGPLALWHLNYFLENGDDRYMDFNPSENKFRGYFGDSASDQGEYLGCDKNGNVILGWKNENEENKLIDLFPDVVWLFDPYDIPSDFSSASCLPEKNTIIVEVPSDANYNLCSENGAIVGHAEDGVFVSTDNDMRYIADIGQAIDNDRRSGRVIIKNNEVNLRSGNALNVEIIGSNAINRVIANQPVACIYDGNNNELEIAVEDETKITCQISNVSSRDKYVNVEYTTTIPANKQLSILVDKKNQLTVTSNYEGTIDEIVMKNEQQEEKILKNMKLSDLTELNVEEILKEGNESKLSGSGSGGFSGSYNYPVKVDSTGDATVTLDKNYAVAGDKITITVQPKSGKAVDEVIVTDKDNKVIAVTKVGDNQYSFTMPSGQVKVAVTTKAAAYDKRIVLQINNRNVLINSTTFANDVAPVIVDDRTMVPIRVITEALGGRADWNAATQTVTLTIDGSVLRMTIGQTIAGFDAAPVILNDRTYVPIRYVAEKLGANVEWIANTQQIIIEK